MSDSRVPEPVETPPAATPGPRSPIDENGEVTSEYIAYVMGTSLSELEKAKLLTTAGLSAAQAQSLQEDQQRADPDLYERDVAAEMRKQHIREEANRRLHSKTEGTFHTFGLAELLSRPSPGWWVEGMVPRSAVGFLSGPSGTGKSFVAVDIACAVASGPSNMFWHGGRDLGKGRVLFVVGEGAEDFGKRILAWQKHTGIAIDPAQMRFADQGVNLSDPDSVDLIGKSIIEDEIDLVVFDTYSQLSGVPDENNAVMNGDVIKAAKKLRQLRGGTTILFLHHVNAAGKSRGSSTLYSNSDFTIMLKPTAKGFTLSTETKNHGKQKNGKGITLQGFELEEKESSLVVQYTGKAPIDEIWITLSDYMDADVEYSSSELQRLFPEMSDRQWQAAIKNYNDMAGGPLVRLGTGRGTKYVLPEVAKPKPSGKPKRTPVPQSSTFRKED